MNPAVLCVCVVSVACPVSAPLAALRRGSSPGFWSGLPELLTRIGNCAAYGGHVGGCRWHVVSTVLVVFHHRRVITWLGYYRLANLLKLVPALVFPFDLRSLKPDRPCSRSVEP